MFWVFKNSCFIFCFLRSIVRCFIHVTTGLSSTTDPYITLVPCWGMFSIYESQPRPFHWSLPLAPSVCIMSSFMAQFVRTFCFLCQITLLSTISILLSSLTCPVSKLCEEAFPKFQKPGRGDSTVPSRETICIESLAVLVPICVSDVTSMQSSPCC